MSASNKTQIKDKREMRRFKRKDFGRCQGMNWRRKLTVFEKSPVDFILADELFEVKFSSILKPKSNLGSETQLPSSDVKNGNHDGLSVMRVLAFL